MALSWASLNAVQPSVHIHLWIRSSSRENPDEGSELEAGKLVILVYGVVGRATIVASHLS